MPFVGQYINKHNCLYIVCVECVGCTGVLWTCNGRAAVHPVSPHCVYCPSPDPLNQPPKTPLQKNMDTLGKQLSFYSMCIIGESFWSLQHTHF